MKWWYDKCVTSFIFTVNLTEEWFPYGLCFNFCQDIARKHTGIQVTWKYITDVHSVLYIKITISLWYSVRYLCLMFSLHWFMLGFCFICLFATVSHISNHKGCIGCNFYTCCWYSHYQITKDALVAVSILVAGTVTTYEEQKLLCHFPDLPSGTFFVGRLQALASLLPVSVLHDGGGNSPISHLWL